jgi:hypothetical protein
VWARTMVAENLPEPIEARTQGALTMNEAEQEAIAAYIDMLARCYIPAHPAYADEGARGIRVCDRWLAGFRNFRAEDVGPPPQSEDAHHE